MAHPQHAWPRDWRHRAAAAVAAPLAAAAVVAAVVGVFHRSSSTPWVAPGSVGAAMVAACDRERSSPARRACVREVVAHVQRRASESSVASAGR